ncbi:hypothetical protein CEP52_017735 [Fusarium oligoseptatum]|uniref:Uncharacterized protein n=1 Tax=Fusarium oligoseptatum TaxID=2604345 RepID=A0A428RI44_9HYPO|nr:hypothetical protein CEP52_017735 [Fusarium oligoseptatum]
MASTQDLELQQSLQQQLQLLQPLLQQLLQRFKSLSENVPPARHEASILIPRPHEQETHENKSNPLLATAS